MISRRDFEEEDFKKRFLREHFMFLEEPSLRGACVGIPRRNSSRTPKFHRRSGNTPSPGPSALSNGSLDGHPSGYPSNAVNGMPPHASIRVLVKNALHGNPFNQNDCGLALWGSLCLHHCVSKSEESRIWGVNYCVKRTI